MHMRWTLADGTRRLPALDWVPHADPAKTVSAGWSSARGFEAVPAGSAHAKPSAEEAHALALAAHLTALARREPDALHPVDAARAAGMHAVASELRREAGRWAECVENYEALVRHHQELGDFKTATAYLDKLVFVAAHAPSPVVEVDAQILAAEVRLAFGDRVGARKAASAAARRAADAADFEALARAAATGTKVSGAPLTLAETFDRKRRCTCGGTRPYLECCAATDRPPTEFVVRAVGNRAGARRPAGSPWLAPGEHGIDAMMALPGPQGDARNWVSLAVIDGRHEIVTLPNWSARAMHASRAMHAYSLEHPEGCEGPSSAILQVVCALESFICTAMHFMARDNGARWTSTKIPVERLRSDGRKYNGGLEPRWREIGGGLFGGAWTAKARLDDLLLLTHLRSNLCHFRERGIERVSTDRLDPRSLVVKFGRLEAFQVDGAIRPGPGHWVDRLLTPHLAGWAVDLGEHLITSFRTTWAEHARAAEAEEALASMDDEPPGDPAEEQWASA